MGTVGGDQNITSNQMNLFSVVVVVVVVVIVKVVVMVMGISLFCKLIIFVEYCQFLYSRTVRVLNDQTM